MQTQSDKGPASLKPAGKVSWPWLLALVLGLSLLGLNAWLLEAVSGTTPGKGGEGGPNGPRLSSPCSIKVPDPEPADLSELARIKPDQAMAAALAAYPGAKVRSVALENEKGCLIYSVVLSNGLEVKVDAGNGAVLRIQEEDDED